MKCINTCIVLYGFKYCYQYHYIHLWYFTYTMIKVQLYYYLIDIYIKWLCRYLVINFCYKNLLLKYDVFFLSIFNWSNCWHHYQDLYLHCIEYWFLAGVWKLSENYLFFIRITCPICPLAPIIHNLCNLYIPSWLYFRLVCVLLTKRH